MSNIVITGASSGIGLFLTQKLLSEGHTVYGLSRRTPTLEHKNFFWKACDVTSFEQLLKAAGQIQSADALICCAGTQGEMGPAMKADPESWCQTVRQNIEGTYLSIRAFDKALSNSKIRSKIICFSGGGSTSPRANFSAYGIAKTAVVRLVETLAVEWEPLPRDIYAVAPGAIFTQMTKDVLDLGPEKVGEKEYQSALKVAQGGGASLDKVFDLIQFLLKISSNRLSGKLISAPWDDWVTLAESSKSELHSQTWTLRRMLE